MSARPLAEIFPVDDDTNFDPEFMNKLIREIGSRLDAFEALRDGLEKAINQAQDIALERINEILGPAVETASQAIADIQATLQAARDYLAQLEQQGVGIDQVAGLRGELTAITEAVDAVYTKTEVADLIAEAEDRALALSIAL